VVVCGPGSAMGSGKVCVGGVGCAIVGVGVSQYLVRGGGWEGVRGESERLELGLGMGACGRGERELVKEPVKELGS
jgi:hypothetical protein